MVSPTHADICFYCSALISPYWLLHTGSAQIYIIPTPGPSIFEMMGQGQVRPIKFCFGEPRPGPARQNFRGWAAAQPGPSNFQRMGPGPAQTITFFLIHGPALTFSKVSARPGPAHHMTTKPMKHGLYMGRPMCCPVLKGACAYADVIL